MYQKVYDRYKKHPQYNKETKANNIAMVYIPDPFRGKYSSIRDLRQKKGVGGKIFRVLSFFSFFFAVS